jgi:hypothetical protein
METVMPAKPKAAEPLRVALTSFVYVGADGHEAFVHREQLFAPDHEAVVRYPANFCSQLVPSWERPDPDAEVRIAASEQAVADREEFKFSRTPAE